jgi:hypothetical protein
LLASAETAYAEALPLLAEDKASLVVDATGLADATAAFAQTVQQLLIQYTLNPATQGLARLVEQVGGAHLDQMRRTTASLQRITEECTLAHQAVTQLAGELLNVLGKYQGLADSLAKAQGSKFQLGIQAMNFEIACEKWTLLSSYARQLLASNSLFPALTP